MVSNEIRFWIFFMISLSFLSVGILSLVRALQGGGSIQYIGFVCMVVGFLIFGVLALALRKGKWPWE